VTRYYLGVDGGGTNCRVRLADADLKTLAEAKKGRANLQIDNGDPGYDAIIEGTRDCFKVAGIDHAETTNTYACFGMAGGRSELSRRQFADRDWPFGGVRVFDDIDIAHAGSLGGEDGAVIIAGTGSAALAMVGGQRFQCGGWGFLVGDQMSGAILGRELIRYTVEATDGLVPASPLTEAVLAFLGGSNAEIMDWAFGNAHKLRIVDETGHDGSADPKLQELLERFSVGRGPAEYGQRGLIELFFAHYESGDPVARQLMDLQMSYIDNYVNWFKARGATKMAVVGGLADRLFKRLQERYGAFVVPRQGEPLDGALILARQHFPI
jgi:glucosamine kinase